MKLKSKNKTSVSFSPNILRRLNMEEKGSNVARMEKTTYAYKILFWTPEVLISRETRRQGDQI